MWKKGDACALLVRLKLVQLQKKNSMDVPQNPTIPLLGIYQKKVQTLIQKDIGTSMFIAA